MAVEMAAAVDIVAALAIEVADSTEYSAVEVGMVARVVDPTEAARPTAVVVQGEMVMTVVDTDSWLNPFYFTQ
jgi:hypothetical protein